MAERCFDYEYHPGEELVLRFRRPRRDAACPGREHLRAACKEVLLAMRAVLDGALEHIERREGPDAGRPTKIEVE